MEMSPGPRTVHISVNHRHDVIRHDVITLEVLDINEPETIFFIKVTNNKDIKDIFNFQFILFNSK